MDSGEVVTPSQIREGSSGLAHDFNIHDLSPLDRQRFYRGHERQTRSNFISFAKFLSIPHQAGSFHQAAPHPPLLFPIRNSHNRPQIPFGNRIFSLFHRLQKQNRLLDVRSQIQKITDLRDSGPRDVPQSRQFRVVGHDAVADQAFEPYCQGHKLGHTRHTWGHGRGFGRFPGLHFLRAPLAGLEMAEDFGDYLTLTARKPGVPFEVASSTTNTEGGNVTVEETTAGFAGRNEVQKLQLVGTYSGGTFTISWDAGSGTETTAGIAYNATPADVQTALENLATPVPGDFLVTGQSGGPWYVTFKGNYAETDVNLMSLDGTNLTGNGDVVIDTITEGSEYSNTIQYYVLDASQGQYTLSLYGESSTNIDYDATAAEVQSALESISSIGAGNVAVYAGYQLASLGGRRVYFIEFIGDLAGQSVQALDYDIGTLGGGGATPFNEVPQVIATGGVSNQRVVIVDYHDANGGYIGFSYNGGTADYSYNYGLTDLDLLANALAQNLQLYGSFYGRAGLFAIKFSSTTASILDTFSVDDSQLTNGSGSSQVIQYEGLSGGANEVQQLWIFATGGTFDVTFDGQTTSGIAWNASAATIETALEGLSNILDVSVTGSGTAADPWVITFEDPGAENVPELTGDGTNLTGGGGTVTTVTTAAASVDEQQTITLGVGVTGGSFKLSFDGEPTGSIAYNANAATVESALEALVGIDGVTVTGTGPWVVTFNGALVSGQNLALLVADGSDLIGAAGTETLTLEASTFSAGPNHFNDPLNFTGGRVPDTGDVLYVDAGTISILYGMRMRSTFTVSGDTLNLAGGDFVEDQIVQVRSTDTLPAGLAADTDYYIVTRDAGADTLQLSLTSGGTAISISDAGTGVWFLRACFDSTPESLDFANTLSR